jgi:Gly-Xaa carboxypeptidase
MLMSTHSSVNATLSRDAELLMDLVAKFNLSVMVNGQLLTPVGPAYGSLSLRTPQSLDPAPVSPIYGAFRLLARSIRTARRTAGAYVIVAPGLLTGNTGASPFALLVWFQPQCANASWRRRHALLVAPFEKYLPL